MFVDNKVLMLSSGNGGAGCVAFRREKFVIKGGPNGGDGGRGGDVYFKVDKNTNTLAHFHHTKHLKAQNGKPGMGSNMTGKSGENLIVNVPPGTQVYNNESGELLLDLLNDGDEVLLFKGGKGGLGNARFKSSTNQRPEYAQPGIKGESIEVRLELKLIADVGLVGFPNVGKSTLISTLSNARPEVANYEFTTLTPKLGHVIVDDANNFVMADIPGIIEGASDGRGLGLQFLKHIERTKTLLFMIDIANYRELSVQYETLKVELERFSKEMVGKSYAVALTRSDVLSEEEVQEKTQQFITMCGLEPSKKSIYAASETFSFYETIDSDQDTPRFIYPVSSVSGLNIRPLVFALHSMVNA